MTDRICKEKGVRGGLSNGRDMTISQVPDNTPAQLVLSAGSGGGAESQVLNKVRRIVFPLSGVGSGPLQTQNSLRFRKLKVQMLNPGGCALRFPRALIELGTILLWQAEADCLRTAAAQHLITGPGSGVLLEVNHDSAGRIKA